MEIPSTINDPIQFLFWSLDEIYPVAMGLIWGIWFDQLLLGWMAIRVYRRFRDRHPDGHLSHRLYWLGFYFVEARTLPNPYVRVFTLPENDHSRLSASFEAIASAALCGQADAAGTGADECTAADRLPESQTGC